MGPTYCRYGPRRTRPMEPYMRPLNEMDLEALHLEIGFTHFEIRPFEEFPGALSPANTSWRFPWVVIAARK